MIENEIDYLSNITVENLVPASSGKRFANLIIDEIAYSIISYCFGLIIGKMGMEAEVSNSGFQFTSLFSGWLFYVLIMFIMETLLKGKSLGKLVTKTRAVNAEDGCIISTKTALLRSIIRIVPFEPFSALGSPCRPWHDKWTNTVVVED